jgi:UDP-glucose 4-epimerase
MVMASYLVTGGAGFVASHIIERLIADKHGVVTIDDLSTGYAENVHPNCEFIKGRCEDPAVTAKLKGRRFDAILHLAGQSSGERSFRDCTDECSRNVLSTLNLIKYALDSGTRRFLYASSMAVYGDVLDRPAAENLPPCPVSVYGVSKLASENYLSVYAKHGLEPTCLRLFNTYGIRQDLSNLDQGMISIYLSMAVRQRKIIVKGSLDRFRDYIEVSDMVEIWLRALRSPRAIGKILNAGTGAKTKVADLLTMLTEYVRAATGWPEIPIEVSGTTLGDVRGNYADMSFASSIIELPRFMTVSEGLRRFIAWAVQLEARKEKTA